MSDEHRPRPIVRRLLVALAVITVVGAGFVALVLVPIPLFPHHRQIGGFSLYSDRPFAADLDAAIREVEGSTSAADPDGDDGAYRVFLSHSRRKYAFFCAVAGRSADSQALVFTRSRGIILSVAGIEAIRGRNGGRPPHVIPSMETHDRPPSSVRQTCGTAKVEIVQ